MLRRLLRTRSRAAIAASGLAAFFGLTLLSAPALAGEKEEARRHFKAGMQAMQEGQYEKGIAELKEAYAILPHANVLYNIARAYAESGDLETSVVYYRKYLAENPPDKEEVEAVVRSLEARLAKSKAAAAAAAAASGTGGTGTGTGTGTEAGTGTGSEGSGSGTGTGAPSKGGGSGVTGDKSEIGKSKEENVYEDKVVTASKGEQSPLDSPSSTYVITQQDIRLSGIDDVQELLQRVPGIDSAQMTAGDHNLSIRGFNSRLSNKLLVLVNGRSVYLDFLGTTFWDALSINVEDIERIEVVRGPGSALYGADAFMGVVNIITIEPGEGKNGVSTSLGTQSGAPLSYYRGATWATGKANKWNYRVSAGYEQNPRWSREVDQTKRTDLGYFSNNYNLGDQHSQIDVRLTRAITKDVKFGIGGGFSSFYRNFYAIGALTDTATQARIGDLTAFINSPHFNVRSFLYVIDSVAGQSVFYRGDPSYRGPAQSTIFDNEVQYANEFKTGSLTHDVRVGLGYRYKDIAWSYLDRQFRVEHHFNGYVQDSVKIGEKFIVIGSMRADRVPYLGKIIASPRGSVIYKRTKTDAFRFTVSQAFRKPTFLESYVDFPVTTPNTGAEVLSQGAKQDDPAYRTQQEKITSLEVGYQNQASDYITAELNLYYNRVSDLIVLSQLRSQTPTTYAKGAGGYNEATGRHTAAYSGFTNDCQVFHSFGGEAGFRAFPITGVDVYGSYAYNNVLQTAPGGCNATIKDERTSQHKVIAGVQYRSKSGFNAELDVWFQSRQIWAEQRVNVATREIEYQRYLLDSFPLFNGRVGYRFGAVTPLDVGITFSNLFATSIREHPFGQIIGRRVSLTATYRF